MVQELIPLLPPSLTSGQLAVCIIALLVGVMMWLIGGVFGRAVVTLIAVAIGGALGMMLPRWYLWPVNSMSIAVLGAVLLGISAYAIPRVWVGLTLGVLLCAWAVLGTWIMLRGDGVFEPRFEWHVANMIWPEYVKDFCSRFPDTVRRVMPYSVASAMVSGLAFTLLWPRFGRTLMGSTLGVTLIFIAALALIVGRYPAGLIYIPTEWQAQVGMLAGFVLLGALIQWQLLPAPRGANALDEAEAQQSLQAEGR